MKSTTSSICSGVAPPPHEALAYVAVQLARIQIKRQVPYMHILIEHGRKQRQLAKLFLISVDINPAGDLHGFVEPLPGDGELVI